MNIALLNQIRDAAGEFLPLERLGSSAGQVREDIETLEWFGFGFEWHPYLGVAYRGAAQRLCPDQIEFDLNTKVIGRRVAVWNRVGSTNDLAAAALHSRANEGLVILAEEQTAGRGQRGRQWAAPSSTSILMSLLIFPPEELAEPVWLTALGALAVVDLVSTSVGQQARIKWPNDVRVEGRKLAGILVERGLGSVIGIGLNVNLRAADFPAELSDTATSLQTLTGSEAPLDRSEIARQLIQRLDERYVASLKDGPEALAEDWARVSEHLGRWVRVATPHQSWEGRLDALDFRLGMRLTQQSDPSPRIVDLGQVVSLVELPEPG